MRSSALKPTWTGQTYQWSKLHQMIRRWRAISGRMQIRGKKFQLTIDLLDGHRNHSNRQKLHHPLLHRERYHHQETPEGLNWNSQKLRARIPLQCLAFQWSVV